MLKCSPGPAMQAFKNKIKPDQYQNPLPFQDVFFCFAFFFFFDKWNKKQNKTFTLSYIQGLPVLRQIRFFVKRRVQRTFRNLYYVICG